MKHRLSLFILFLLFWARPQVQAQLSANWVTHPDMQGSEQAIVLFRTTFKLNRVPKEFLVDIKVLGCTLTLTLVDGQLSGEVHTESVPVDFSWGGKRVRAAAGAAETIAW